MGISDKDRKILWGRSGNRCAMCRQALVAQRTAADDEAVVGDEAHIAARSPGGPRYGECPPHASDRYENLILLCRVHHKVVDDQPLHYSAEHLRRLKAEHEEWVNRLLSGPAPERGPGATLPRQLPAAARLVGRHDDLSALQALAAEAVAETADVAGPAVLAIDGPPGVGTSALAVALAHELADRFPDGQLYVDLRYEPVSADAALVGVLRSFGVPEDDIPTGDGQREARYRSVVAGRRVLVVVDNVWEFGQVAPFVPPNSGSLVLMTSRVALAGPVGARHRSIEPLSHAHGVELLRLAVRTPLTGWYPEADEQLARLCGGLPLLLTAVAAVLNGRGFGDAGLARGLTSGRLTLSTLDTARAPVTASLAASYRRLSPAAAHAFRRLGAFPVKNVTDNVLEALTGIKRTVGDDVRRALANERLLGRPLLRDYDILPPFRLFAYHLLVEEMGPDGPETVFSEALSRYTAEASSSISMWLGPPNSHDPEMAEFFRRSGLVFFQLEIENLVELLIEAFHLGKWEGVLELSAPVIEFLARRDEHDLWDVVAENALEAAVELPKNPEVSRILLRGLHDRYRRLDRPEDARECLEAGRRIARSESDSASFREFTRLLVDIDEEELAEATTAGDQDRIAESRMDLGDLYADLDRPDVARDHLQAALSHFRRVGDTRNEAHALLSMGELIATTRRPAAAVEVLEESVRLFRRAADDKGLALALHFLARTFEHLGRSADARRAAEEVAALDPELAEELR